MDCVDAFSRTGAAGCCCWLLLLVAAVDCCCWLLPLIVAAGCCCWLLLLVAAVDCCCWLLLLIVAVDCCCWLLLLIAAVDCPRSLWIFPEYSWWFAAKTICRRRSLWIFSNCWWSAAKTNLQAKKSLNSFGLLMISLWIFSGCWWKVIEYFRVVGEKSLEISRILMGEKWKRSSPRRSRLESGMNAMAESRLFILEFSRWPPFKWEPIRSFGKKWRAGRLGL